MTIDYMAVGRRIKQARHEKNYTQAHLAELLSVTPEYISRVECASTNPSLQIIAKMADLLSVNLTYLLEGTSTGHDNYKLEEFSELLQQLSAEKRKMLYEIGLVILHS
jgi:Predicted transcriptional regulators